MPTAAERLHNCGGTSVEQAAASWLSIVELANGVDRLALAMRPERDRRRRGRLAVVHVVHTASDAAFARRSPAGLAVAHVLVLFCDQFMTILGMARRFVAV
jgi:hypothetical protein